MTHPRICKHEERHLSKLLKEIFLGIQLPSTEKGKTFFAEDVARLAADYANVLPKCAKCKKN